jgi:hypothetical protein
MIYGASAGTAATLAIGTANQQLVVSGGVPAWATSPDIAKSTLTTTGDIIYASGSATPARLGIGTASQVLSVSGGVPAWTTPASGGVSTTGWSGYNFGATTRLSTYPRWATSQTATSTGAGWGAISLTRLIAPYDFTATNIALVCASRSTSTATVIRFGIYTRSGTTFTLVARTASDTSIFAATETKYTRALDTAGGYPATYSLTAGSEYWIGLIIVASGTYPYLLMGSLPGADAGRVATGNELYTVASQSDLATTPTGVANASAPGVYAELT